jgi:DNA mismatch repair protein MutS2
MMRSVMREGDKTAADLEWPSLLSLVAESVASEQARARLLGLLPAADRGEARSRMERTAAALEALALAEPVPAPGVPTIDEALERLARAGVLTLEELGDLRRMLVGARRVRAAPCRERVPLLREILAVDPALDRDLEALERALDDRGGLADGASPALARARGKLVAARRELQSELSRQSARLDDVLRDQSWVERDGRYGLPVRADAHRRVEGIILGTSATGATLYVEPPAITALSNRVRLAEAEVDREEARIVAALSADLARSSDALAAAYEICIEADVLAAISRFAEAHRAIAVMVDDEPRIALERIRHPLLVRQGVEVVANDVAIASGQALVISGPNAGGKTVALKCLGLSVWMARAGLPLPVAEGSAVGWFDVVTDIGDEQSIERSLSTFSAEVQNLADILAHAGGRTLVLLDEVAGGTDPDEGSALAAAVLEALVARGSAVAVTTHYERLKELAADDARFVNASVGFDFEAMQPTFTLTLGVPGASSALAVATRFGMPVEVVARARERLSEVAVSREDLLVQLERERKLAAAARREAERDAEEARRLLSAAEEERATVREKERSKIAAETSGLIARVRQARAQLETVSKDLGARTTTARAAERAVDEAASLAALGGPLDRLTRPDAPPPPPAVAVGDTVYVRRLGSTAVVEEPPAGGEVRVRAGAFSLRVPLSELGRAEPPPKTSSKSAPKARQKVPATPSVIPERVLRTSGNTCDLRGMRVEEALETLEVFMDGCVSGEHDEISFALHGHGTGALKRAVREHLALSGRVAASRPAELDEGGDAFTVFRVRG